ncbi:hypothetical protein FOZ62_021224, partial [Perkinsus olseni]
LLTNMSELLCALSDAGIEVVYCKARSFAEALSALVTWHEERRLSISSIEAYVDSSTVYRWCKGSPLTIKTKTVERQAINRLLNAIREHVEYFAANGVKFQLKLIT